MEAGAPPVENGSSNHKTWVPSVADGVSPVGDGAPQEKIGGPINTNPRQTRLWESGKGDGENLP